MIELLSLFIGLVILFLLLKRDDKVKIVRVPSKTASKPSQKPKKQKKNVKGDGAHRVVRGKAGLYDGPVQQYPDGAGVVPSESLKYTSSDSPLIYDRRFPSPFHNTLYDGLYSSPYLGLSFFGNVDADAKGFKTIKTKWEKVGLLTTVADDDDSILNLFRRDIAPYRDMYEYAAEDKNGFIIPLSKNVTYLENGDIVDSVVGKDTEGPWKVNLFYENKYIYV